MRIVNARFQCNRPVVTAQKPEMQPIESLTLNEWEIKFRPIFPQERAQVIESAGHDFKQCAQESGKHLDAGR